MYEVNLEVYTRKGDSGETDTANGSRIKKFNPIIEWEGTLDELNSVIGLARSHIKFEDIKNDLVQVQFDLFHLGEHVLTRGQGRRLREDGVKWLEERTNFYFKEVGEIKLFVLPGGSSEAAFLQFARTVTRRAERITVELNESEKLDKIILQYMNRLSSLLFVMALVSNKRQGIKELIFPWPNPENKK